MTNHDTSTAQRRRDMLEFATAVAEHLEGVTASQRDDTMAADFTDKDGRGFLIVWPWNVERAEIVGDYPRHPERGRWYPDNAPRIGVSITRNPEHVARDIARRFLPKFAETYDAWLATIAAHHAYKDAERATAETMRAALGLAADPRAREDEPGRVELRHHTSGPYGRLECGPARVDLELHNVPPALAERIAELLAEHFDKETAAANDHATGA